jgi:hypothetical protein
MTQNNQGHQSVLRWQIADNVPFHSGFEASIEKYFPNSRGTLYACTVCWYLEPNGKDPYAPTPVAQRQDYYERPPLEGGGFKIIGQPNGAVQSQSMTGFGNGGQWEDDDQLWWTNAAPGSILTIELPVEKTGEYDVMATMTKAKDYGIMEFYIDGNVLGDPIDLYNPEVIRTDEIKLGTVALESGTHEFQVKVVGSNEKAIKSHMFGLDTLSLRPVD